MQAFGGIMSTTGEPGRPPVRVGPSIVDMGTGMWAVIGVLTMLLARRDTGRGGIVGVSLFETAATWVSPRCDLPGVRPGAAQAGLGAIGIVPYRAYATRNGNLVVAAASDALFQRLADALGHAEWRDDPRFATNPLRVEHQAALYALIEATMRTRTTLDWMTRLESAGIPCAPVQGMADMLAHPQTQALDLLQSVPGSSMRFVGSPIPRSTGAPAAPDTPAAPRRTHRRLAAEPAGDAAHARTRPR